MSKNKVNKKFFLEIKKKRIINKNVISVKKIKNFNLIG